MIDPTIDLATQLIQRPSITPNDQGCQALLAERLKVLDFQIEPLRFGEVDNLWARRGEDMPLFVFAGHTDVVPTGDESRWQFPPFAATQAEGLLYGRGAADMKGSLAAMIVATEQFIHAHPEHHGSIAFLLTSDEEGDAINGTVKVIEQLQARQELIDWCLVGEPSSQSQLGDIVKNGRRGSLGAKLIIKGVQGHIAYPHLADNPIHRFAPALQALCSTQWDNGNAFFPPTSFQISNVNAGTGVTNVIPGHCEVLFNFRFSTEVTHTQLQQQVEALLDEHQLDYELTWQLSGQPFLTETGALLTATQQAIETVCGYTTQLSTGGGTSDGRFIAPTGAQVLELGPLNATIHKVNECVSMEDLIQLTQVYEQILKRLLL